MRELIRVLIVSSATVLASEIEIALGPAYEVHAAATDDAAATLLNTHEYDCVVLDARPTYPTIPITTRPDIGLMAGVTVVVESDVDIADLAAAIKSSRR